MKRTMALMILPVLVLGACAPDLPEDDVAASDLSTQDAATEGAGTEDAAADADSAEKDPSEDLTLITCGADRVLDLVGTPLAAESGRLPEGYRPIAPGDLVTQDYDTKRMNVFVSEKGVITRIDCG